MKAKDADRLNAIRFLSAAIKQREIELRESGKEVTPHAQLLWALFVMHHVGCGAAYVSSEHSRRKYSADNSGSIEVVNIQRRMGGVQEL
jgi:uncharacterized protein YqeY